MISVMTRLASEFNLNGRSDRTSILLVSPRSVHAGQPTPNILAFLSNLKISSSKVLRETPNVSSFFIRAKQAWAPKSSTTAELRTSHLLFSALSSLSGLSGFAMCTPDPQTHKPQRAGVPCRTHRCYPRMNHNEKNNVNQRIAIRRESDRDRRRRTA